MKSSYIGKLIYSDGSIMKTLLEHALKDPSHA